MLLKILGVGICTVIISLVLKQYKPEFALLANVCGGLIIFLLVIDSCRQIVDSFIYIQDSANMKVEIVSPILKVIGIGYITEFTADLAEDSGNKTIASKIVMGGKVAICLLALPIIKTLLNSIISLI